MRKTKRIVALLAAATMLMSSMTVLAADVTNPDDANNGTGITGTGTLEGYVTTDYFSVQLPTTTAAGITFAVDPQGLLNAVDSSKYGISSGAVYFTNTTELGTSYSNSSDAIEVINKSTYEVDVEFAVNVTVPEGVTLVSSEEDLENATTPSLYLGLKIDGGDAVTVTSGNFSAAKQTVDAVPVVTETASHGYVKYASTTSKAASGGLNETTGNSATGTAYYYGLEESSGWDDAALDKASYVLTGACDSTADWSGITGSDTVSATVIWNCKKHVDVVAATGYGSWSEGVAWLAKSSSEGFGSDATISAFTVNGETCAYTLNDTGWISVTWDQVVAAGQGEVTAWEFKVTIGNTIYTITTGE